MDVLVSRRVLETVLVYVAGSDFEKAKKIAIQRAGNVGQKCYTRAIDDVMADAVEFAPDGIRVMRR
jgi:hypothetical protein